MVVENRGSDHSTVVSLGPGVGWGGVGWVVSPGCALGPAPGWLPAHVRAGEGGAVALHV